MVAPGEPGIPSTQGPGGQAQPSQPRASWPQEAISLKSREREERGAREDSWGAVDSPGAQHQGPQQGGSPRPRQPDQAAWVLQDDRREAIWAKTKGLGGDRASR